MKISSSTRRDIIDSLKIQRVNWTGNLNDPDFLSRIFDLEQMPSYDGRFPNAAGDIWQHRINNYDWEDDWIFNDDRFMLLSGDDDIFLRFLCEMIHPVVRSDYQEVEMLLQLFNELLAKDNYEIVERSRIFGRPVFSARLKIVKSPTSIKSAKNIADVFNADYLSQQITRLEASILHDPDLTIGTAKELVETCCKTILTDLGEPIDNTWDLAQLVKATTKQLRLTPDDIPDSAKSSRTIKRLLSNLASVTQGLAELRNSYGTGHGRNASAKGLSSRHAKLAAGAATTLAVFLFETHEEKNQRN